MRARWRLGRVVAGTVAGTVEGMVEGKVEPRRVGIRMVARC